MVINKELLSSNAASLGVDLSEDMLDKFDLLASLLIEQNKTMNLTAITQPNEVVVKHFADSLSLLSAIEVPQGAKVLDLGTGAGFPGLPLLIARPDIRLTMVDSTAKKLAYVASTLDKLSLSAETLHARAEEAGKDPAYREQYDIVCPRGRRAQCALRILPAFCQGRRHLRSNEECQGSRGVAARRESDIDPRRQNRRSKELHSLRRRRKNTDHYQKDFANSAEIPPSVRSNRQKAPLILIEYAVKCRFRAHEKAGQTLRRVLSSR